MRRRTLWDLRRPGVEAALPTSGQRPAGLLLRARETDLRGSTGSRSDGPWGWYPWAAPALCRKFPCRRCRTTRDVAARPREARDESEPAGIAHDRHDDRDRRGGVLGCRRCRRRPRYDDVHLETNQLGREFGQPVESTI